MAPSSLDIRPKAASVTDEQSTFVDSLPSDKALGHTLSYYKGTLSTVVDACPLGQSIMPNGITTMMICNIPVRISIGEVVDAVDSCGFQCDYDLVYMPMRQDSRGQRHKRILSLGYAFVNFKDTQTAADFSRAFQGISFPNSSSTKKSFVRPAHVQGYDAYLEMHTKHMSSGHLLVWR